MGGLVRLAVWELLIIVTLSVVCGGHTGQCDMDEPSCEFYLDVTDWLPMRPGYSKKAYINETDGKLYSYNDNSNTVVDPNDVVLADGSNHERALKLFNKTMPGPTLTVYVNQLVLVHVRNNMLSDGVTVHFHGMEMRGTPWMDGAAFITQCPILPGQTFTYKFRPNRSGTYFYHSHTGVQITMGLVGPFIVKERAKEEIEEHVMVIQDYNNMYTFNNYASAVLFVPITNEGVAHAPEPLIDGSVKTLLVLTSSLINGRGRVLDDQGAHVTKTPLTVFTVALGKKYRFRVIGGGYGLQYKVSVDGHRLKMIATDGHDIEPIETDFFIMHTGERFDFIIEANQTVGNFWIRAQPLYKFRDLTGYSILRYDGAEEVDPTTIIKECTQNSPCTVVNCPFETYPNWTCINIDELHAPGTSDPAADASSGNFKEFFVNVGYGLSELGRVMGSMNGVSLKLPTVSALTQPREVTGICSESDHCEPNKLCSCIRPLDVNFGDVVQMNFINMGFLNVVHHPVHVHGYSFHVLKVGYRPTNESFAYLGNNADINCQPPFCNYNASWSNQSWQGGNIAMTNDLTRAPRKDTLTVPAGGYVVIRFVADNPGLWNIHCHMDWHASAMGMGLLLNDSFSQVPPPPPGFPECRNFPAPDWVANREAFQPAETPTTQSNTAENGRTFSQEEFWGMFAVLIFVIILQFVLAMYCMRNRCPERRGNADLSVLHNDPTTKVKQTDRFNNFK